MPAKQVSQATFDAIVREAIEDFGLSEQEALDDAKEQLSKAGVVDFSNIITSIVTNNADDHPAVLFVASLKNAETSSKRLHLLVDFAARANETEMTDELLGVAGAQGAVENVANILSDAIDAITHSDNNTEALALACAACNTIVTLCSKNELNRMRFVKAVPDTIDTLKTLLLYLETALRIESNAVILDLTLAALRTVRSAQRNNESVKQRVARGATLDHLLSILDVCAHTFCDVQATRAACIVFRQLLASDDNTELVSETFNRARVLAGERAATQSGLRPLDHSKTLPFALLDVLRADNMSSAVIAEALGAARMCAVADEICKAMIEIGYVEEVVKLLNDEQVIVVTRAAVALLRNLAARDDCKTKLAEFVPIVICASRNRKDGSMTEHCCAFLAGLCLRRPDLAKKFSVDGVLADVVQMMTDFEDVPTVLRAGCHALRNAGSRDTDARAIIRSINGVEARIREAMRRFPTTCDGPGYDALRDLDFLAMSEMRRDERYKLPDSVLSANPNNSS